VLPNSFLILEHAPFFRRNLTTSMCFKVDMSYRFRYYSYRLAFPQPFRPLGSCFPS
jgi:hypothetical protein